MSMARNQSSCRMGCGVVEGTTSTVTTSKNPQCSHVTCVQKMYQVAPSATINQMRLVPNYRFFLHPREISPGSRCSSTHGLKRC